MDRRTAELKEEERLVRRGFDEESAGALQITRALTLPAGRRAAGEKRKDQSKRYRRKK